jgi:hypothetical protein
MQDLNKDTLVSMLSSLHDALQLLECSTSVAEECENRVSAMGQLVDAYETDYMRKVMAMQDGVPQGSSVLVEELLAVRAKVLDARVRMAAAQEQEKLAKAHKREDVLKVRSLRESVQKTLALD